MAKNVQFLGMSASQLSSVIGLARQCIVDTTAWTLRVMDGATPGGFTLLSAANNLSDLVNKITARSNLGLGTAATSNIGDFDAAGAAAAAQAASDPVGSAATAQSNAESFATSADTTVLSTAEAFATAADVTNLAAAEANTTSQINALGLRIGTAKIFVQNGGSPPMMQNGDICVIY